MMAVLELPPRLACSMRVSLLSLNGTWLLPCTTPCYVMLAVTDSLCQTCARHALQFCSPQTFLLHMSQTAQVSLYHVMCALVMRLSGSTETNAVEASVMTHSTMPDVCMAQGTHQALHGTSGLPDGYCCY